MLPLRTVSLLAIVAVLGLVQATLAASAKGNAEAGKKLYLESCQSCHGPTLSLIHISEPTRPY